LAVVRRVRFEEDDQQLSRNFPDPDPLDLAREEATGHLAFAGGIHYCPGATLARLEGEVVFSTLLEAAPPSSS
jgi:cytochrome P450